MLPCVMCFESMGSIPQHKPHFTEMKRLSQVTQSLKGPLQSFFSQLVSLTPLFMWSACLAILNSIIKHLCL